MAIVIDLSLTIKQLSDRYDDIRNYTLDPNGPPFSQQESQVTVFLTKISQDIALLSAILANQTAASVTITPPSAAAAAQLSASLTTLGSVIQSNQAFNNFINGVTTVLGAADTIAKNAHA
jgi:hypothetical protein